MWEPRCLTTLWASTACYRDSFTCFTFFTPMSFKWSLFCRCSYRFLCHRHFPQEYGGVYMSFVVLFSISLLILPSHCLLFSFSVASYCSPVLKGPVSYIFPSALPVVTRAPVWPWSEGQHVARYTAVHGGQYCDCFASPNTSNYRAGK
jgi:hypothetical protein